MSEEELLSLLRWIDLDCALRALGFTRSPALKDIEEDRFFQSETGMLFELPPDLQRASRYVHAIRIACVLPDKKIEALQWLRQKIHADPVQPLKQLIDDEMKYQASQAETAPSLPAIPQKHLQLPARQMNIIHWSDEIVVTEFVAQQLSKTTRKIPAIHLDEKLTEEDETTEKRRVVA